MTNGTKHLEQDGNRKIEVWRSADGTMHCTDGPAYRRFLGDNCEVEIWAQNGEYFRPGNEPNAISWPGKYGGGPRGVTQIQYWLQGPVGDLLYPANKTVRKHRMGEPAVIWLRDDGTVAGERWYVDGELHRAGAPAEIEYNSAGQIVMQAWHVNGERSAGPDHPSLEEFYDDGVLRRQLWFENTVLHRSDGPAYLEWFPDGELRTEEYWIDGAMTRVGAPAVLDYYPGGATKCEQWRIGNQLHRDDGPAVAFSHPSGEIAELQWWIDGQRRRSEGPAIELFDESGTRTASFDLVTPEAQPMIERTSYQTSTSDPASDHQRQMRDGDLGLGLRLWHRWVLGLDSAPDDAPFTQPSWLVDAPEHELRNRLAYFPDSAALVDRVLQWRRWHIEPAPTFDTEQVTRAYVAFVASMRDGDEYHDLCMQALAGEFVVLDQTPHKGEGEYFAWELDDSADEMPVPRLLHESIYHVSGNWFMPIFWILQPLHGVDVSPWHDFDRAELRVVISETGLRVGPRR